MTMTRPMNKEFAMLLLPFLLGACATSGSQSGYMTNSYKEAQKLLVISEREDRTRIEGAGEVAISSTYTAASGRKCRKLETLDGRALPLRSCDSGKGEWYTTRSISLLDSFSSSAKSVKSESSVEARTAVAESVSMKLSAGETLWGFAARVTGNALNWKNIAEFNNIEDANSIRADQLLEVESSLLLEVL
ncbi:LysM peptidoglycan-binding domain-containing protein [Granulosicoccus antarcticus]|uniref:LysM domain-containing protein n=1 Tax=Granulosicoccus antarcticus IMCC3135 TaxID=1192854 RepID=A0A2Z2NJY1_9GAMM|nr:LysM peptidoglycan-binding domain-containing protein [Granulosicoccus antarcticus]ASJ71606.1 hypothetical protein IMCC3135_07505 [Granulosicoccus antarcticus IMCC3135]